MLVIGNAGRLADDRDLHLSAVPLPLAALGHALENAKARWGLALRVDLARAREARASHPQK